MFFNFLIVSITSKEHRILAVLGSKDEMKKYSTFFNDLQSISSSLEYEICGNDLIPIERFGSKLYDTIVITCGKSSCFPHDAEDLKNFLDTGGNAIVFTSEQGSDIQDKLYRHLNIRVLGSNKIVDILENSEVILRNFVAPNSVVSKKINPLVYEGGFATIDRPNEFRFPIVTGSLEHITQSNDRLSSTSSFANDIIPIYCLQSRTGGRVLFIHSNSFASDEFFNKQVKLSSELVPLPKPIENGNRQLLQELSKWVTSYKSYIKIVEATHFDSKTKESPVQYHIKQNITVVAKVIEHINGEVVPHQDNDVQVEIFMLGTFVRRHMKLQSPGQYVETFTIPDRAGNYKIKVFTAKDGFYNGREEMAIAVRPLAIREKEKFIQCALPYSNSMIVIMIGAFLATIHFLYHKPTNN